MTIPLPLSAFARLPSPVEARLVDGLPAAIDQVTGAGPPERSFLRHGWYAAAIDAYGGRPRTLIVTDEESRRPLVALSIVDVGPRGLRLGCVPGCYWPMRGVPAAQDATPAAWTALVSTLGRSVRALRVGPVPDGDPAMAGLLTTARARGWTTIDRVVAQGWLLDLTAPDWPRGSTLRKNRFHEKHLAAHGAIDWRFLGGADWPAAFDLLAEVERASWIATATDGRDAKFSSDAHGGFWRAAARDPVLAAAMSAAVLTIDGRPAAFSFDLDAGTTRYAIANSYDPAFAKHSPGRLLQYRNLARARAMGIERVDWGMGDAGYKQAMGATAGPLLRDWLLLRPGLPALLGRMMAERWRLSGAMPAR